MERASYSRVNSILKCPKQYKEVGFQSNENLRFGLKLHNILENYIEHGYIDEFMLSEIDPEFITKIVEILQLDGEEQLISEYEILSTDFKGYVDLIIIDKKTNTMAILDLKTIKKTSKKFYKIKTSEQLNLYASYLQEIDEFKGYNVVIGYILYLKDSKKMELDAMCLDQEYCNTIRHNFGQKTSVARHILDNDFDFPIKNDFCFLCPLVKICERKNDAKF